MDRAFFRRGLLTFQESGHRGHAETDASITSLPRIQKQLYEEVVHNAIGRIRAPTHQIACDFAPIDGDQVDKRKHGSDAIHEDEYRLGAQVLGIKLAESETTFATAWNPQPLV